MSTRRLVPCSDCGNDAQDETCKRWAEPDGPLCQECRLGQLYLHMFCWKCGGGLFTFTRTGIVEWARITAFSDDDAPVIDDSSWDSDGGSADGAAWVDCRTCSARLVDVEGFEIEGAS